MQERQGESFVIATANDISTLPPELVRKGRFDETWFVDLPTTEERKSIVLAALAAHGRKGLKKIDVDAIADATVDFTGAEIAALVPDALFAAFADKGREPTTTDLLEAAKAVVPLAKTAVEKIVALRTWAKGCARPAGRDETPAKTAPKKQRDRVLDI